jgi:hypothetical protein
MEYAVTEIVVEGEEISAFLPSVRADTSAHFSTLVRCARRRAITWIHMHGAYQHAHFQQGYP